MNFIRVKSNKDEHLEELMKLYEISFPVYEQRRIKDQLEALKDNNYYCMAICSKDTFIGLLCYWDLDGITYVEHLAIETDLRGQSYGSKILKEFCKGKKVVLEIDPPIDKVSINRQRFYNNLGFKLHDYEHIHPPYRKEFNGHKLKVMSYGDNLTYDEYSNFNRMLKEEVMRCSENNK